MMDLAIIMTKDMSAKKSKTIIPLALMASESIAHSAFGLMGYCLIAHSDSRNNIVKYSRVKSTEYLLRSVFLFWMVGPLPCRSFHKRDQERSGILQSLQEIFRTFLSSINIEHCPKYIKKLALITVHVLVRSYKPSMHMRDAKFESFTKVPFAGIFRQF